jgi:hypothetical protein
LDFLLSEVTTTTVFLLRPQYDALLSENQKKLKSKLLAFIQQVDENSMKAPEWKSVEKMLTELGWGEEENIKWIISGNR